MKHILLISLILCSGCASIKYKDFSYVRIGNQNINDFKVTTSDGIEVQFTSLENKEIESLKNISEKLTELSL